MVVRFLRVFFHAINGPAGFASLIYFSRAVLGRISHRFLPGRLWPQHLVISAGGTATTTLLEFLQKFGDTNSPGDLDGIKHLPYVPARALRSGSKVLYIAGDPDAAEASLRRRNLLFFQVLKLLGRKNFAKILETRGLGAAFKLLEQEQRAAFSSYESVSVKVLTLDQVFDQVDEVLGFFGIWSPEARAEFPRRQERVGVGHHRPHVGKGPHRVSNAGQNVPVLLINYRRPDLTERLIDRLREVGTKQVVFFSDHWPTMRQRGSVLRVRQLIRNFDWDVEVRVLEPEVNLGAKDGPREAITYFFRSFESGIVLEDDIYPELSFFDFAAELLSRYSDDERIGLISATCQASFPAPETQSYVFSRNKATWGWASWARVWKNYREDLLLPSENMFGSVAAALGSGSTRVREHWHAAAERLRQDSVTAWDWHFFFSLGAQSQLTIFPPHNLATNQGFRRDATHTFGRVPHYVSSSDEIRFPLLHPQAVVPFAPFDESFEKNKMFLSVRT